MAFLSDEEAPTPPIVLPKGMRHSRFKYTTVIFIYIGGKSVNVKITGRMKLTK